LKTVLKENNTIANWNRSNIYDPANRKNRCNHERLLSKAKQGTP